MDWHIYGMLPTDADPEVCWICARPFGVVPGARGRPGVTQIWAVPGL
jgi:hypothetical protein